MQAGNGFPDDDLLWVSVCGHYLWKEDLSFKWPESLKLTAISTRTGRLQQLAPHQLYLYLSQHPLSMLDLLENVWSIRQNRPLKVPIPMNVQQALAKVGSFGLRPLTQAKALEKAWKSGVAGQDPTKIHRLLRAWWWSLNHAKDSWDPYAEIWSYSPNRDLNALARCLQALLEVPELSALERTEALRQLGHFEEAQSEYQSIELRQSGLDGDKIYELIGRLIADRITEPRECLWPRRAADTP